MILARKVGSLEDQNILPGWLDRTSCYAASSALKGEHRRRNREHEAYMQSAFDTAGTENAWQKLSPLLEDAMLRLGHPAR